MRRVAQPAFVGARGIDCVSVITPAFADWLVANGFEYVNRYLGSLTNEEVDVIHSRHLAVMPVCYADRFDGAQALAALQALAMPLAVTTWADVESIRDLTVLALIQRLNEWATPLHLAKYDPGGYFGNDTLLTSVQMGHLIIDRYWKSASKVVDAQGHLAEPTLETGPIGWCQYQLCPGNLTTYRGKPTPAPIDIDVIQEDYRLRPPTWCVGLP